MPKTCAVCSVYACKNITKFYLRKNVIFLPYFLRSPAHRYCGGLAASCLMIVSLSITVVGLSNGVYHAGASIAATVMHRSGGCLSVFLSPFLARDVIYTSRAYATMSVSVCL